MTLHSAPPLGSPVSWNLITSSFKVPAGDSLASFKTLNKLTHVMARAQAADQGADEALLINTRGQVAETASGNIFWIQQDTICTTPADRGVLPGVTRAVVIELCQSLGWPVRQRTIRPAAMRKCGGIFITQSVLGVVPVTRFDGEWIVSSPRVERLQRAYGRMLEGRSGANQLADE